MKYVAVAAFLAVSALASFYYYNHKSNSVTLNSYGTFFNMEVDDQWKEIQSILDEKPETIADFLRLAKEKRLVSFYTYSLVHKTRSMQKSSLLYPRVIMSGTSLFLAFNGSKDHDGYGALEVMTYNRKEEAFKFREVLFVKEASKKDFEKITEEEIEEKTATHWISKANPSICMDCHSMNYSFDPRPIWDSYNRWPGVYGAIDDELGIQRESLPKLDEKETDNFKAFQKQVKDEQHPRYSLLHPISVSSHKGKKTTNDERPNLMLNRKFSYLMGRRAARQMLNDESARRYRYAILHLYTCNGFSGDIKSRTELLFPNDPDIFLPPDRSAIGEQLGMQNSKYHLSKITRILTEDFQLSPEQISKMPYGQYVEDNNWCKNKNCDEQQVSLSIYFLLRKLKLNLADWDPLLEEIPLTFYLDFNVNFIHGFADALMESSQASPEVLEKLKRFGYFTFSNDISQKQKDKMCSDLKDLSREALQ